MPSVPHRRDYAHSSRESLPKRLLRLMCAYHSVPSLVRSLPLCLLGKRRSLLNTTRLAPHSTDKRRRARRGLPRQTVPPPPAKSQHPTPRIVHPPPNSP